MSKIGRNELCPCGSGKKFKRCHGLTSESTRSGRFLMVAVGIGVLAAVAAGLAAFTTDRSSSVRVFDPAHGHYHDATGTQVP
ncbi:MAG TPA: SEC-C metal-binding domain-containing protein [Vicinamibacterales bacterium]|jgi:hypothetical protein|nr:SEC-C metal-binding domain-containing protein [Vicinamibacterales bacterium]